MADFLSLAGLLLILAGWLFELKGSLERGRAGVPLRFSLLYASGSLILAYHSLQIGDDVFLALNSAAMLVAFANICLSLKEGGRKTKRGK
jgi:lipid-A-disaccharide synthase-like uncharacterized protein